jgi:hypothetical protein
VVVAPPARPEVVVAPPAPVVVAPPAPPEVVVAPPAPPATRVVVVQAPPPAAPAPAPRDCGTGPSDAGCQETRDGHYAMERDLWSGYYTTLKATAGDLNRAGIVETMLKENMVTAQQFMALLDLFHSDLVKLDIARDHETHVIDPQRALGYGAKFRGSLSRADYVKIMSGQH